MPTMIDALWVRIIDVPRALTGRRYASPVDVVIEVRDELLPANARGRSTIRTHRASISCGLVRRGSARW